MQQTEQSIKSYPNVTTAKQSRFSSIELLKIIAILLICISHAAQTVEGFIDFWSPTWNLRYITLQIMRCFGQIGNAVFIICSSWFLLDSKKTKAEKAINLLLDSMAISVLIMVGFLIGGEELTKRTIFQQVFTDIYKNNWFIPVYVMFYCVHGLLNSAIEKMTVKSHLAFCVISYILFYVLGALNLSPDGSMLIGFITIYFAVAFMKKYCKKINDSLKINLIGFSMFLAFFLLEVFFNNLLRAKTKYALNINYLLSPVFLPMLLCLFNIFKKLKFKSTIINYVSSCSLFIYCIHENILLRERIRPKFFEYVFERFGYNTIVLGVFLCGIGLFIGALILSFVYKQTIHKITSVSANKIKDFSSKVFDNSIEKFMKRD